MNEQAFYNIASEDFYNFSELVKKGFFETSDFIDEVLNLANTLLALHQELTQTINQG